WKTPISTSVSALEGTGSGRRGIDVQADVVEDVVALAVVDVCHNLADEDLVELGRQRTEVVAQDDGAGEVAELVGVGEGLRGRLEPGFDVREPRRFQVGARLLRGGEETP